MGLMGGPMLLLFTYLRGLGCGGRVLRKHHLVVLEMLSWTL